MPTKQTIEQKKKAALLQRITDVYSGAQGAEWDPDCDFANAEILGKVISVFMTMFDAEGRDFMWKPHCLEYFDTPKTAFEFLWGNGVRA